jgi:hypothetical protein
MQEAEQLELAHEVNAHRAPASSERLGAPLVAAKESSYPLSLLVYSYQA